MTRSNVEVPYPYNENPNAALDELSDHVDWLVTTNYDEPWYGDWRTIGNAPGSIGFSGQPTSAPATTVGSGGVTLPLDNGTVPISDCSVLSANGGSFKLGDHIVVYSGRSASSGAGNATGCWTLSDASGTFPSGTALGYESIGFGALAIYQKFGDEEGSNQPVPGTTQAAYLLANYYGPTVNDSAEAFSVFAGIKDTGTGFAQNRPATAFEAQAQIEGANTMPGGINYPLLAGGFRTNVTGDSHVAVAMGMKLSHNSSGGPDFGFTDTYYGIYQTTSALATYTTLNGSVSLPQATIAVVDGSAMPPATPDHPVTIRLGTNPQGYGGKYVTYTGISGNDLTGCTGGSGSVSSGTPVVNISTTLYARDQVFSRVGFASNAGGNSNIEIAHAGVTDSLGSQVYIRGANSGDTGGTFTQLRLVAGTGQTNPIFSITNSSGIRRFSLIHSGQLQMLGADGNTQTMALDPRGGIYPGKTIGSTYSVSAGGIFAGSGAPGNIDGRTEGSFYFRDDGGSLTTIYQYRSGSWVGIV